MSESPACQESSPAQLAAALAPPPPLLLWLPGGWLPACWPPSQCVLMLTRGCAYLVCAGPADEQEAPEATANPALHRLHWELARRCAAACSLPLLHSRWQTAFLLYPMFACCTCCRICVQQAAHVFAPGDSPTSDCWPPNPPRELQGGGARNAAAGGRSVGGFSVLRPAPSRLHHSLLHP